MINPLTGLEETAEEEALRLKGGGYFSLGPAPLASLQPSPGSGLTPPATPALPPLPSQQTPEAGPLPPPVVAAQPPPAATKAPAHASHTPRGSAAPRSPDELSSIATERQAANTQQTEEAAKSAQLRADAATQAADALQAQQEQAAQRQALAKGEYDRLQAVSREEDDKYKNAGFRDFWADKSSGTKALAAISMALGSLGQGVAAAGGASLPNTALQIINQAIERDWALQKERLGKQKDIADAARQDAHGAQLAWAAAEANTIARQKDAIAAAIDKAAVANGAPEALAKGKAMSAQLRTDAVMERQKAKQADAQLANTRADTNLKYAEADKAKALGAAAGGAKGKPTASEEGAAADAANMVSNLEQIKALPPLSQDDLKKIAANKTSIKSAAEPKSFLGGVAANFGRSVGAVPYSETEGLSPKAQQAYLAWQNVRSSMAHVLTGAGMSDSEREDYIRRYTPQPGDDATTVKAKVISAQKFVQDSLIKAGKVAPQVQGRLDTVTQAPAPGEGKLDKLREAQAWLRDNPDNPRAPLWRAKVTEMLRSGL